MMSAFSMNIFNSVAVVTFDTPDQKVNILNLATLEEFGENLDQLEEMGTDLKGAVIISAKERNFIAGADLSLIEGISDPDEGAAQRDHEQHEHRKENRLHPAWGNINV